MSLVVPYDGSPLSKAALVRAAQFERVFESGLFVVSVIPTNNTQYARARGWIDARAPFDSDAIVSHLESGIAELAPDAEFHPLFVGKHSPRGTIANRIRKFAGDHDATMVFIGSESAGRVVSALTVGQSVAGGGAYDTVIISNERLPAIDVLEERLLADDVLP